MSNPYHDPLTLKVLGSQLLSQISHSLTDIVQSPILPRVSPGFLTDKISENPPMEGTPLPVLFTELEDLIKPGLVLTNHPLYFAEMSGQISESTILSEIFINTFHTPGFSWEASPSQTELENIVMDWFAELTGLPQRFLIKNEGGGSLSTTTTHSYFHSINVAKFKKMEELNIDFLNEKTLKFVAYFPEINRKKALKALKMKEVTEIREIPMVFEEKTFNYQMNVEVLLKTIVNDIEKGFIPFWCDCSLGSEGLCNIDDIEKIGEICKKYGLALNINANWGGFFLMLSQFKDKFKKSLEYADFILMNGRYLLAGGYTGFMYFSDKMLFRKSVGGLMGYPMVDLNLKKKNVMHMKDFSIGFGKRFNNFKLYFMIRRIGAEGIRKFLQKKISLGQIFEENLRKIEGFEIKQRNEFGVICFKAKFEDLNKGNEDFLNEINRESQTGVIGGVRVGDEFLLRVSVNNENTEEKHILQILEKIQNIYLKKVKG